MEFLKRYIVFAVLAFLLMNQVCLGQSTTGPKKGSLVVVGGGGAGEEILKKFIELAGGEDQKLIVIPTAAGRDSYDQNAGVADRLRALGAKDVLVVHTNDKAVANSDQFLAAMEGAMGIWFGGGRQWRLVDAYGDTKTEDFFWKVLDKGGVIGGSSAGATIQGSYLARGDTKNNQIMMGDHEEGFGFISDIAIDQHLLRRNRQFDLLEITAAKPELLGIGLDEDTAIVVRNNRFEVIGNSYVVIYDNERQIDSGGSFYFLEPGDQFDFEERQAYRPGRTLMPLDRIVDAEQ